MPAVADVEHSLPLDYGHLQDWQRVVMEARLLLLNHLRFLSLDMGHGVAQAYLVEQACKGTLLDEIQCQIACTTIKSGASCILSAQIFAVGGGRSCCFLSESVYLLNAY